MCQAIEIDPAYVDVAVKRWQDFTGETGKLQASGQSEARIRPRVNGGGFQTFVVSSVRVPRPCA